MSEVLKWFEDNIYYSVNSENATFFIQNEDLWEFEELLKKQDRELQQKDNIIKEVRELLNTQLAFTSNYQLNYQSALYIIEEAKGILDKENK